MLGFSARQLDELAVMQYSNTPLQIGGRWSFAVRSLGSHSNKIHARATPFLGPVGNFMKKFLITLGAVAALTAPASAADLPARPFTKAPAVAVDASYNWSGIYGGAYVGGLWSDKRWDGNVFVFGLMGPFGADYQNRGVIGGGQIGFNYQVGQIVLGVQADWGKSDAKGQAIPCNQLLAGGGGAIARCAGEVRDIASVTGRIGYAWDRTLLYVKGGGAWVRDEYELGRGEPQNVAIGGNLFGNVETRSGWTVGAGVEYGFWQNLSVFAEYNYYDFGSRVVVLPAHIIPNFNQTVNIRQDAHVVKVGLNVRFNWAQPVVAKY
jgi:outer membrane immunogenic protein